MLRRMLLALCGAMLFGPVLSADEPALHFESGKDKDGKPIKIRIERFDPFFKKNCPPLLLVPESKSLDDVGTTYRMIAKLLAQKGYVVFMVHFFDRTGHKGVKPNDIRRDDFLAWLETVRDAARFSLKQPGIRPGKIGLIGFSLGGFLSLSLPLKYPKLPVAAVVDLFGGLPEELRKTMDGKLPPTLVIHGAEDRIVPVEEARAVERFCKERETVCEMRIFKTDHLFGKDLRKALAGKKLTPVTILQALAACQNVLDAQTVAGDFLRKYLNE